MTAPHPNPATTGGPVGSRAYRPRATSVTVPKLRHPMPSDTAVSWVVTLTLVLVALGLRLWGLSHPAKLVFDETYYPKDAWSMLQHGYERNWAEDANDRIVAGETDLMEDDAAFVVHPPMGKWMIALGELAFGLTPFGWRVSAAVVGSLMVGVLSRLVRRISRSTLVGALAGLLLTVDGLHFVMSRTGLLDIFQAFFTICAVACLVVDRDWYRGRLADHLERTGRTDLGGAFGPTWWWRPWRLAAGVCWGLGVATKWNTLVVLAGFALLSLAWDVGARRLAGAGRRSWWAVLLDGVPSFAYQVLAAVPVYLATWTGWLATTGGYDRDSDPDPLVALGQYHRDMWDFHTGEYIRNATHTYDAHPRGWLVLARPTGIDAVNDIAPGSPGCAGPGECISVISAIGTPLLWWGALFALIAACLLWVATRDWRFGIPVVGVATTWLPWFPNADRPVFFFYAVMIIPFTVTALALVMGLLLGRGGTPASPADRSRRRIAAYGCGLFVALVVVNFAFFWPILTDQVIPRTAWEARMWFQSWI